MLMLCMLEESIEMVKVKSVLGLVMHFTKYTDYLVV